MNTRAFFEELDAIILENRLMLFQTDYKTILEKSLEAYARVSANASEEEAASYEKVLQRTLFNLAVILTKDELKDYVRLLYDAKIGGGNICGAIGRLIPERFMKLRLTVYMLKTKKLKYFINQYKFFEYKPVQRTLRFFGRVMSEKSLEPFRYLLPNQLRLPTVDLIITTKCTLRCKYCSNLINCYQNPQDAADDTVIKTIQKLQECATRIDELVFIGGETFIHPHLKCFIQKVSPSICRKISVVTNGTILPTDPELLSIMREKKVQVIFSNYGNLSNRQIEATELLNKNHVSYAVMSSSARWYNFGEPRFYPKTEKELQRQFSRCTTAFIVSSINGNLYLCPRSAHGHDMGLTSPASDEYVDLLSNTKKENIRAIKKLLRRNKPFQICNYCLYMTDQCEIAPRALQME